MPTTTALGDPPLCTKLRKTSYCNILTTLVLPPYHEQRAVISPLQTAKQRQSIAATVFLAGTKLSQRLLTTATSIWWWWGGSFAYRD